MSNAANRRSRSASFIMCAFVIAAGSPRPTRVRLDHAVVHRHLAAGVAGPTDTSPNQTTAAAAVIFSSRLDPFFWQPVSAHHHAGATPESSRGLGAGWRSAE